MVCLAVCDDDQSYLEYAGEVLRKQAEKMGLEAEILSFLSPDQLLQAIKDRKYRINMLFLDIQFGGETSLNTAKQISILQPMCHIVFLTNYLSYALDVCEIPHLYYVIKDEFVDRMDRVFSVYFSGEQNAKISISMRGAAEVLMLRDICYIERMRRSCQVITETGRIRSSSPFEDIIGSIHAEYIIRCHNSFLVNLQHVKKYQSNCFRMINGDEVPISRLYSKTVKEKFWKWVEVWT